ncbi:MAG: hypothetical protein RMJ97_11005 [Raineya sp.]|nr:hypothetical protein [Raineya sp.]MDW8297397.1 hypothetical protein [Raineya sp.]
METKVINKAVNLTQTTAVDFKEVEDMLKSGWQIKETHSNVELVADKHVLYITFTFVKS